MDHWESLLYALAVIVLFLALLFIALVVRKKLTPHQLPLPPGPKGIPPLGDALAIDRREPWLTFREWGASYGDVVSYKFLGQTYVVVNSEKAAKALLEQHSSMYSDRPMVRACSLFGMGSNATRLTRDDIAMPHREILYQNLNGSIIHRYHNPATETTRTLLLNLLHSPERFENHLRTYAASIVMSVTYGYNVIPRDDPLDAAIEEMMHIVLQVTPGRAVFLSRFPKMFSLPWFPGVELWRLVKQCKALSAKIRDIPFQFVKDCLAKDIENDSMVAQLLKDEGAAAQSQESYERDIKDCATSNLIAGIYTIQSTLSALMMALILYPEAQDQAQAAIDRVVGRNRLPTVNDRASLLYIDALLWETLRWCTLVPMAIPHEVTKDVIFEQRLIPKGSIVLQNLWGMARDEESFPDATAFRPERHLDSEGKLLQNDSDLYFGYGRSARPGRYLADAAIWLAAATMLSAFRFDKAIGPAGYRVDVSPKFIGGVVR